MKIDTIDISTFGATILNMGYPDLISFPPMKEVEFNSWAELDGIEPDLSDPKTGAKTIQIKFCFRGENKDVRGFLDLLRDGNSHHTFLFDEIQRSYELRLKSTVNYSCGEIDFITFEFEEDVPLKTYTYIPPSSTIPNHHTYKLDGICLEDYGIRCLYGSLDSVMKPAQIKQNLVRDIKIENGTIFNGTLFKYKEKTVTLKCFLKASSLAQMWQNYDAFFYNLTQPNIKELNVKYTEITYPCFYKSCKVTNFSPLNYWIEFDLNLIFTSSYEKIEEFLLSTEDEILITTEDGLYFNVIN